MELNNTNSIRDKVILITGASSSIGEATARHLAKDGAIVVLAARRADRLRKITDDILWLFTVYSGLQSENAIMPYETRN